jgi:hypothetical protein
MLRKNYFVYLLISGIVLIGALSSDAQVPKGYYDGWILFNDGQKVEAYVAPFFHYDEAIGYMKKGNGKDKRKEKAKSSEIKEVAIYFDNKFNLFHKEMMGRYTFKEKIKMSKTPSWVHVVHDTDKIKGYFFVFEDQNYSKGAAGVYSFKSWSGVGLAVKTPDMDYVLYMSQIMDPFTDVFKTFDTQFRKVASNLCDEKCPTMTARIEAERYKCSDFEKFITDYAATCK